MFEDKKTRKNLIIALSVALVILALSLAYVYWGQSGEGTAPLAEPSTINDASSAPTIEEPRLSESEAQKKMDELLKLPVPSTISGKVKRIEEMVYLTNAQAARDAVGQMLVELKKEPEAAFESFSESLKNPELNEMKKIPLWAMASELNVDTQKKLSLAKELCTNAKSYRLFMAPIGFMNAQKVSHKEMREMLEKTKLSNEDKRSIMAMMPMIFVERIN